MDYFFHSKCKSGNAGIMETFPKQSRALSCAYRRREVKRMSKVCYCEHIHTRTHTLNNSQRPGVTRALAVLIGLAPSYRIKKGDVETLNSSHT